jgi:hypothetical protein
MVSGQVYGQLQRWLGRFLRIGALVLVGASTLDASPPEHSLVIPAWKTPAPEELIQLRACQGVSYFPDRDLCIARGGVYSQGPAFQLWSKTLWLWMQGAGHKTVQRLQATDCVVFTYQDVTLWAQRLDYDQDKGLAQAWAPWVVADFQPKAAADDQSQSTGLLRVRHHLDYDIKAGVVSARQGFWLRYGDLTLSANQGKAGLSKEPVDRAGGHKDKRASRGLGRGLKWASAQTDVQVQQSGRKATANWAVYRADQDVLELGGNVRLWQDAYSQSFKAVRPSGVQQSHEQSHSQQSHSQQSRSQQSRSQQSHFGQNKRPQPRDRQELCQQEAFKQAHTAGGQHLIWDGARGHVILEGVGNNLAWMRLRGKETALFKKNDRRGQASLKPNAKAVGKGAGKSAGTGTGKGSSNRRP